MSDPTPTPDHIQLARPAAPLSDRSSPAPPAHVRLPGRPSASPLIPAVPCSSPAPPPPRWLLGCHVRFSLFCSELGPTSLPYVEGHFGRPLSPWWPPSARSARRPKRVLRVSNSSLTTGLRTHTPTIQTQSCPLAPGALATLVSVSWLPGRLPCRQKPRGDGLWLPRAPQEAE